MRTKSFLAAAGLALWAALAMAQGTDIALSGLVVDRSKPVEMTSDALTVDQASGAAVFEGHVVIAQDLLTMTADSVEVIYDAATGEIAHLRASGNVRFQTDAELIEADAADYDLIAGLLVTSGNVRLSQGAMVITAAKMTVNINDSSARLEGGVRTVLQGVGN